MSDKGKRAKVEENDGSEQLDTELVLSIQKLQDVQDALEKVSLSLSLSHSVMLLGFFSALHGILSRLE
jgi:hypothetical protein